LQTTPDKRILDISYILGAKTSPTTLKYNNFNELKGNACRLNRNHGKLARFFRCLSYTECWADLKTRTKGRERWQRKKKVLLIDNDRFSLSVLQRLVDDPGYEALIGTTAEATSTLRETQSIEVIVFNQDLEAE